jgi:hybrid cluster-associated redox disulfide protein
MKKASKAKAGKIKKIKAVIKPNMTIAEIVSRWPQTERVLMKNGMPCIGCFVAMQETLEQGAALHGINLKKLLAELEKATKKQNKKCVKIK